MESVGEPSCQRSSGDSPNIGSPDESELVSSIQKKLVPLARAEAEKGRIDQGRRIGAGLPWRLIAVLRNIIEQLITYASSTAFWQPLKLNARDLHRMGSGLSREP
jgi:hypothetical protein